MLITILLSAVLSSNATAHSMDFDNYNNINTWKKEPKIILCRNKTKFSKKEVENAVTLWKASVSEVEVLENCNYNIEPGVIKITDNKYLNKNEWGRTTFNYLERENRHGETYKIFTGAVVQLDKYIDDTNLLLHELGHAFGYGHYDKKYDVMNSKAVYWR